MKKRILLIAGAVLLLLVLVAAIGWWWLTATRSGAMFVLGQVQSRVESMEWSRLEGGFRGGVIVHDLRLRQAGLEVAADRVALAARVRPAPPFDVRIDRLALTDLIVTLPPSDPDAPSEPFVPGDYRLPVPIHVDDFALNGFELRSAAGGDPAAAPLRIDRVELVASAFENVSIERLEVDAPQGELRLNGRAGLAEPWILDLDARVRPVLEGVDLAAVLALDGSLADLGLDAELSGAVRGRLESRIRGLPDVGAVNGSLAWTGSLVEWPGLDGRIDDMAIRVEGAPEEWTASGGLVTRLAGVPEASLDFDAEGNLESVGPATLRADLLDGRVTVTGDANWAGDPRATARVELARLDFTTLYPDWPDQARLQGGMNVVFADGAVAIDNMALQAPPAALELTGEARYRLEDQYASAALDWTALTWPPVLGDAEPLFSSESGRFEGRGTLADWQAEIAAWLQVPDQPRTRVEVDAEGDEAEARILRGLVQPEDAGELRLTGRAGLATPLSADLDLALSRFDPGALVPQLPGRIDGQARLKLDDALSVLTIESLSGQLRGQTLGGSGSVAVRETTVEEASLNLSLGENQASIQRPSDTRWTVEISASRLDQLWPTLAGSLTAEAAIVAAEQRVEWTLDSPGLIVGQRRAGALTSRGVANWGDVPGATARITAENVDLNPWERLDRVELVIAGDCAAHRMNAYASGTRATIDLAAGGSLADCADPTGAWSGQLDRLVIAETPLGLWQLDRPLEITRANERVTTGPACLWTVGHDGRLCLNALDAGQSEAGPDGRAAVAFNSVPMDLLLLPLDPAFSVDSELRGLAQVNWDGMGLSAIDGRLLLDEGPIRLLGTEGELLTLNRADLRLTSPQPRAVRADLALRLEGQSEIDGHMLIPDLTDPASATIDSRLSLTLPRLSAFNRLVPQLDALQGQLDAELVVAGPLRAPEFDGQAQLTGGRVHQAPLGMDLTEIDLRLAGDESGGRLTGSFRAGEGTGRLDGRVVAETGDWSGTVSVDGERLGVFDTDWLKMQISPDLTADFNAERLALDGTLVLDSARLGLPPGAEQRVAPSPDVVVVGSDDEGADEDAAASTRPITGSIAFRLGDDVRLEAAGMATRLAGGLDITWAGNRAIPTAEGKIELVDGAYRAYGQNLDVQRGDVIFTGNPIDNPVLDIAAVREIFGDPAVEFAGVEIRGPAQDPEIELFTTPPTSREKALAYVLTGAAFDHAAGQGAFNVGLWVLPNVFVSYGVGLFDSGNVLATRWDLSRRWGLRATSGESDTGADLSFIIDR